MSARPTERAVRYFLDGAWVLGQSHPPVQPAHVTATRKFFASPALLADLVELISVYEPSAHLRLVIGDDITVSAGEIVPEMPAPPGGPDILRRLEALLASQDDPWRVLIDYVRLHPFTDCNGRSGRALWGWRMLRTPGGLPKPPHSFLTDFYYQASAYA